MEETEKKKKDRGSTATIKKPFIWGQVTQKMMSFKIDLELVARLQGEANKGRLINELLRKHYEEVDGNTDCMDIPME